MTARETPPTAAPTDTEPACCAPAAHALQEPELATDVERLAALGNDTRYEILRLIAAADEDVCVCEIEPAVGVGQSAVSQALSRLYTAGLVTRRKAGRWRYYATTAAADRLLETLDDTRTTTDA